MAKLTFNRSELAALLKQAKETHSDCINLVGDDGVYFMNPLERAPRQCVYANGCNPSINDDWFDLKRQTFGGDDGVERFSIASIAKWFAAYDGHHTVTLSINKNAIRLLVPANDPQ